MKEIDVAINDDYAVLTTYNYGFYYGYEFDRKECECGETIDIWGFEVDEPNTKLEDKFRISYEDMKKYKGCPSQWQCEECLLFGIGLWLESRLEKR